MIPQKSHILIHHSIKVSGHIITSGTFAVCTFVSLLAILLSGCIHINVTKRSTKASNTSTFLIHQQDPSNPGQFIETILGSAISTDRLRPTNCQECELRLVNHRQQTGSWCSAAAALTAIEFIRSLSHDEDKDQCELANKVFEDEITEANRPTSGSTLPRVHCCKAKRDAPASDGREESRMICDKGSWPDDALIQFGAGSFIVNYSPPFEYDQGWDDLTGQIRRKLPYLAIFRWAGDGRHSVAVGGYSISEIGEKYVHVYDPGQQGFYVMSFEDFHAGIPEEFSHEMDYFNIGQ